MGTSTIFGAVAWFFRWWLGQLVGLVPAGLRRALAARPDMVLIDISGPEVMVLRCGEDRCEEVGRVAAPSNEGADAEGRGELARLLKSAGAGRRTFGLRLSGAQALRKSITLPLAAERELDSVLYHQIEQLTPFQVEEACFGYRVEARNPRAGRIDVEMTVVPRKFVNAALERVARWDLRPDVVDVRAGDATAVPAINLIADARTPRPNPWPRIAGVLGVLALVLAAIALFIPVEKARIRADALLAEAAKLRGASAEVVALRRERDALERGVRFLAARKAESRQILDALAELTRILPGDTWLYQISIDRPEARIWGYSPSAASLIGKINDSPLFGNPRFRSPVTRAAGAAKERFNISFELRPRQTEEAP